MARIMRVVEWPSRGLDYENIFGESPGCFPLDTSTASLLSKKIDFGSCFQEVSTCIRIVHGLGGGGDPRKGPPTVRHELI